MAHSQRARKFSPGTDMHTYTFLSGVFCFRADPSISSSPKFPILCNSLQTIICPFPSYIIQHHHSLLNCFLRMCYQCWRLSVHKFHWQFHVFQHSCAPDFLCRTNKHYSFIYYGLVDFWFRLVCCKLDSYLPQASSKPTQLICIWKKSACSVQFGRTDLTPGMNWF